jgi:hypothetical protein
VLDPGVSQERRSAPLHVGGEPSAASAVSRDGRLIAYARSRGVQLYDAETMAAVGPPLEVNWRVLDGIGNLAFDPEGRSLLALLGRSRSWFAWPIASDTRRLDALKLDADLLSPSIEGPRLLRMTSADEHARLRARDPGAWSAHDRRPTPAVARVALQNAIPRRDPDTNPLLLDLTSRYSLGPLSTRKSIDNVLTDLSILPIGVARLDGVDFDIRGGIELRQQNKGRGSHGGRRRRVFPCRLYRSPPSTCCCTPYWRCPSIPSASTPACACTIATAARRCSRSAPNAKSRA